jgi:hypothetical protein
MTTTAPTKPKTPRAEGCWIAHDDVAAIAAFSSEVACLRYAVANGLRATRVEYGVDLRSLLANGPHQTTPTGPRVVE